MKYKIRIAWGSENDQVLSQLDTVEYKKWMMDNGGEYGVLDYEFDTREELNAFLMGIDAADGWFTYNTQIL